MEINREQIINEIESLIVDDYDAPIDRMTIYQGNVRGIKRDNPINKMHIMSVCANDDTILLLAVNPKRKGGERDG